MARSSAAAFDNPQGDCVVGTKGQEPVEKTRHPRSLKGSGVVNLLTLNTIQTIIKSLKPIGLTRLDSHFHGPSAGWLRPIRITSLRYSHSSVASISERRALRIASLIFK